MMVWFLYPQENSTEPPILQPVVPVLQPVVGIGTDLSGGYRPLAVGGQLNEPSPQPRDLKTVYDEASSNVLAQAQQASITVIISCFLRPDSVRQVIDNYLEQTANIERIIIYLSGSPVRDQYLAVLEPLIASEPRLEIFDTGINLGYFGRLQLGIQTFTDFIVFTDDDIMQGQHTLTALVASYYSGYTGVLGVRGCNYVCGGKRDDGSSFEHEGTRTTGYHKPDWHLGEEPLTESDIRLCSQGPDTTHFWPPSGSEVDTLFSFWLMPTSWVRTLFAEAPPTYRTAEDMHISFMMRKYLGRKTYMLQSGHSDFIGSSEAAEKIGNSNRSWVDTTELESAKANVPLTELTASLAGATDENIKNRKYNWERDQVLLLLAERGNTMSRISWIRTEPSKSSAITLLGHRDALTMSREQEAALYAAQTDPTVSVVVVCHQPGCLDYKPAQSHTPDCWLWKMLFGNHQRLLESKVYRITPPTDHAAIYYSRLLLDMSTVVNTLRLKQMIFSERSEHHLELGVAKLVASMHHVASMHFGRSPGIDTITHE